MKMPFLQSLIPLVVTIATLASATFVTLEEDFWENGKDSWKVGGVEGRTEDNIVLEECEKREKPSTGIPSNFDGRYHWKYCPSLWEIRDQGGCASCYAVAIASVLTDRYCIASKGRKLFRFSEQDIMACNGDYIGWGPTVCKDGICTPLNQGCNGGSVERAWKYLTEGKNDKAPKKIGVASGGSYNTQQGCIPYEYPPCNHTQQVINGPFICDPSLNKKRPECIQRCVDSYGISYDRDLKYVNSSCQFTYSQADHANFIEKVQLEILANGPVVAVMKLTPQFAEYDPKDENDIFYIPDDYKLKGVVGNHAVKIIGWGSQYDAKFGKRDYWLVANSYNYYWGLRGFFKIERGDDRIRTSKINAQISTGMPIDS